MSHPSNPILIFTINVNIIFLKIVRYTSSTYTWYHYIIILPQTSSSMRQDEGLDLSVKSNVIYVLECTGSRTYTHLTL